MGGGQREEGGLTIYVHISTEGSGTPTMRPKTGSPEREVGRCIAPHLFKVDITVQNALLN